MCEFGAVEVSGVTDKRVVECL